MNIKAFLKLDISIRCEYLKGHSNNTMTVFENISEKQIFFVYKNFLHGFLLDSCNVLTEYMCERLDSNIELEYFERIKNKLVYYPFVYDFSSNFETV